MKVTVFRTAMVGGGLSYDVYVRADDVPEQMTADANGNHHTRICRDGHTYLDYVDATTPTAHRAMPYGWERYDDHRRHERSARREMLAIARQVFPELHAYTGDTLPTLWVTALPVKRETNKTVVVDVPWKEPAHA